MSSRAILVLAAASFAFRASALTPEETVRRALEANPEHTAALLEARGAAEAVAIEEGRYPFVLTLDATLSRSATPVSTTTLLAVEELDAALLGAELSRAFSTGTLLALRLESGSQTRRTALGGLGTPVELGPSYGALARLQLVQPLVRGAGRDVGESGLRSARITRTAAERAAEQSASVLVRDVLTAYAELWYAQTALEIEESSRKLVGRQQAEAAARAAVGAIASVDVLPFTTRAASLDEAVLQAEQERLRAALVVGRLLAAPGEASSFVAERAPKSAPQVALDEALARALAASPELPALEAQLDLAREDERLAEEALRPRLDLTASAEARGFDRSAFSPALEQVGGGDALGGLLSLTYELPFTGSSRRAAASRARLAVRAAEERLSAARAAIDAQVRTWAAELTATGDRLQLAQQTIDVARRQLEAEEERFLAGAGVSTQVREAEDALRQAELRAARARLEQLRASLALRHLTGALVEEVAALL